MKRRRKAKGLKKALLIHHWHKLVADNSNIGTTELQKRLKPISYLRGKLADPDGAGRQRPGDQLNIFGKEDPK